MGDNGAILSDSFSYCSECVAEVVKNDVAFPNYVRTFCFGDSEYDDKTNAFPDYYINNYSDSGASKECVQPSYFKDHYQNSYDDFSEKMMRDGGIPSDTYDSCLACVNVVVDGDSKYMDYVRTYCYLNQSGEYQYNIINKDTFGDRYHYFIIMKEHDWFPGYYINQYEKSNALALSDSMLVSASKDRGVVECKSRSGSPNELFAETLESKGAGLSNKSIFSLIQRVLGGAAPNAETHSPRFDETGSRVLFLSHATNLVSGEQNAAQQLYQVDLDNGLIRRLSETATGEPANGDISQLELAAEAGKVVFRSEASNLDGGPGLYLQDLATGLREVLVSSTGSTPTDHQAERPAIDANASLLAYDRPDRDGQSQVHSLELATRADRQETPLDAATVSACCARISGDGRYLAWRETDVDGRIRLRLLDEATNTEARVDWPESVDPDNAAIRLEFREGGRELWWVPVEQGAGLPEVLYRALNPVFVAPADLH
jgi:hypothetical protein